MKIIYFLTLAFATNQLFAFENSQYEQQNQTKKQPAKLTPEIIYDKINKRRKAYYTQEIIELVPMTRINLFLNEARRQIFNKNLEKYTYLKTAVEANMAEFYTIEASIYLLLKKTEKCSENKKILHNSAKQAFIQAGHQKYFFPYNINNKEYRELADMRICKEKKDFIIECTKRKQTLPLREKNEKELERDIYLRVAFDVNKNNFKIVGSKKEIIEFLINTAYDTIKINEEENDNSSNINKINEEENDNFFEKLIRINQIIDTYNIYNNKTISTI